jgi:hypothetical protein
MCGAELENQVCTIRKNTFGGEEVISSCNINLSIEIAVLSKKNP